MLLALNNTALVLHSLMQLQSRCKILHAHTPLAPRHTFTQTHTLPAPLGPTIAMREPMSMPMLTPCSPKSSLPGYLKSTSMIWMRGGGSSEGSGKWNST